MTRHVKPRRVENWLHQQSITAKLRPAVLPAKPVKLIDGGGLHLQVNPNGSAWWRFRYRYHGIEKMLGLGTYPTVSLAKARDDRDAARQLLRGGVDPSAARKAMKAAHGETFAAVATAYYAEHKARQKLSDTTRVRDERILKHLTKRIGTRPIVTIETPELSSALRAIAKNNGHETALRALSLASRVYSFALEAGQVPRDPTAGIKLEAAPSTGRAAITKPAQFGELLKAIDRYDGEPVTRVGLRLLALLFTRPAEMRLAHWSEIDLDAAQFVVPAERMKMRREHLVPLPTQAVALLRYLLPITAHQPYVFMSIKRKPLSEAAFGTALAALGYKGQQQPHGFRVSASTMLHELGHSSELIETQLAHSRPGVWGVYNKAHLLPQRVAMLQAWADYLDGLVKDKEQP